MVRYITAVSSTEVISKEFACDELASLPDYAANSATSSAAAILAVLGGGKLATMGSFTPAFVWEVSEERRSSDGLVSYAPARFSTVILQPKRVYAGDSFAQLKQRFPEVWEPSPALGSSIASAATAGLAGGIVGYVSWDASNRIEKIRGQESTAGLPPLFFMSADRGVTLDRETRQICVWHVLTTQTAAARVEAEDWCEEIRQQLIARRAPEQSRRQTLRFERQRHSRAEFEAMVERAKEYIVAGDIFQVVLSNSLEYRGEVDVPRLFERLQQANLSPYHFALSFAEKCWYVGASPEVMLRSKFLASGKHEIFMRPVAGTYPRALDGADDIATAGALAADAKERAEHLMLVDLERNDIGRTAELGSVTVSDLFSVETYQHVHHLVSQVRGILQSRFSVLDALTAAFPIGTLSGTPKVRAMEIIAELEGQPRGIFGGAVVTISPGGVMDSCVAIRSALINQDQLTIQTGAGIVYDSVPSREYEECLWKARSLLRALELEGPPT